jgi:SlyX protein
MSNQYLQEQIEELQIKCSYLEDIVDKLDVVVIHQQTQIDLLIKEVKYLRQQDNSDNKQENSIAKIELPPHY